MRIGYARVSTHDQDLDLQLDDLKKAGCEDIFSEKQSGSIKERPVMEQCLRTLRKGDTLVVWRLDRLGRSLKHLVEIISDLEDRGIGFHSIKESIDTTKSKEIEFNKIVEDAPISKVVAVILKHAVEGGASDIHIEPVQGKVRVRFRLDGVLHSSIFLPFKVLPSVVARIKILATLKIDETRVPQDGRFSTKIKDKIVDFRVSTLPTVLGEKVVIRILDPSQRKITFEDLGMTGRNLKILEEAIKNPFGMILSTGPTGSGKTTSLYTVLGVLNQEGVNVMTLEDPVEYVIEGVNQSQVRPEIDYGFASGLRHMVRQDPDVIMVGEIRDAETASLAIHAALTGHLVLSTLHTTNALGVIPRLLDMGIDQFLLPFTLNVAIGQRLTRKLCLYCRKKVKATGKIKNLIFLFK